MDARVSPLDTGGDEGILDRRQPLPPDVQGGTPGPPIAGSGAGIRGRSG